MSRGGARPGAGRPKGVPNKKTAAFLEGARAQGQLPHEFLLAVSRGEKFGNHEPTFLERIDAAKAAAQFYAPRLAATELSGEVTQRTISAEPMSDDEWERQHGSGMAPAARSPESLN